MHQDKEIIETCEREIATKPYNTPFLKEIGSVAELTQQGDVDRVLLSWLFQDKILSLFLDRGESRGLSLHFVDTNIVFGSALIDYVGAFTLKNEQMPC